MVHRNVIVGYAVPALLSVILAFLTLSSSAQELTPGDPDLLWIKENDKTSTVEDITEAIDEVAQAEGFTVVLDLSDLNNPGNLRHFYIAAGDAGSPGGAWLEDGYPDFGRAMQTQVHSFSELTVADPRGYYLVYGDGGDVRFLQDALADVGLTGQVSTFDELMHWEDYLLADDLMAAVITAALCIAILVGAGVLLGARSYGVLRLNGHSYTRILIRDLVHAVRVWALAGVVTTAATLVFLGFYNGLAQLPLFAIIVGYLIAGLTAVALASHALALGLLHLSSLLSALKGKLPARSTLTAVYLVRTSALVLVLGAVSALGTSIAEANDYRGGFERFAQAGETSRIRLLGSVQGEEMTEAMDNVIGPWLRQSDADGRTILVEQTYPSDFLPTGSPYLDFDVLLVNDTYLEHNEALAPDGEPYGASDTIRVLIPDSLAEHEASLVEGTQSWAEFQTEAPTEVEALPLAGPQEMFTYGTTSQVTLQSLTTVTDPVVVAVPNGSLSAPQYASQASRGGLLFTDPSEAESAIAEGPLATYVNGLQPVALIAADEYGEILSELRVRAVNLIALIAVLAMTAIAAGLVYVRTSAQTIFARHISGWTFIATHRRLLAFEGLLALAFTGWITWDTLRMRAALNAPMTWSREALNTTGVEPLYAAGIAVAGFTLIFATLVYFHGRIVREGASQA
ncbi:bacteriocin-associated integral membrane family protein [Nocardiopsis quinghaiensis]|uniref:bacteriocin-associated integral membrane family protein n=1 Tax=Nocardiopsis quinghaiensis TaxID=464995 RepID=UPI00123AA480|nr:hypothetical protein [Nocardiopsis quinghaiensis]